MAVGNKKTKDFKDRQCRYCGRADKAKFRQNRQCCPLANPQIRTGHCEDREPIKKKSQKKEDK